MKNKGFTLVEVILTIALIGIIAAGFITLFPNYMKWMISTKEKTTLEAFNMQKNIERSIDEVKKSLGNDVEPDAALYDFIEDDIFLFGTKFPKSGEFNKRENIKVYVTSNTSDSGKKVLTWVAETRLPTLPVPVLDNPTLKFVRGSIISNDLKDKFEYYNLSELKMIAQTTVLQNPKNSFYKNKHEWFVSDPGFLIPRPILDDIDIDIDLGKIYPSFPDNYSPIPIYSPELNASNSSTIPNNSINKYKGKHIIYTITPYSKDLKRGIMKTSSPLYLLGPVDSNNLRVHLDASTIDLKDDTLIVENSSIGYTVKKWKNMRSSPIIINNFNATAIESKRPVLISNILYDEPNYVGPVLPFQVETLVDDTEIYSVWGRALGNKPDATDLNTSSIIIEDFIVNNNGFNMFVIMRKTENPIGPIIDGESIIQGKVVGTNNKTWKLKWFDESTIELSVPAEHNPPDIPLNYLSDYNFETGEWNLLNLKLKNNKLFYNVYNLTKGKEDKKDEAKSDKMGNYSNISTKGIEINFNGVEIAEILIYSDDSPGTIDYLIKKYNPEG